MGIRARVAIVALVAGAFVAAILMVRTCGPDAGEPPPPRGGSGATAAGPATPGAAPSREVPPRRNRAQVVVEPVGVAPSSEPSQGTAEPAGHVAAETLRIHGRVVDPDRAGVGGVRLTVRAWSGSDTTSFGVRAGDDGAFDFLVERRFVADGFGIETSADGYLEAWAPRRVGTGASEDLRKLPVYDVVQGVEITVERGRAIVGRVIDGDGRPVHGATVQLWYGSETTWPTAAGADGRFRTPPRAPRRAFQLHVEVPGYPIRRIELAAADAELTDVGDLVFRRGGVVAGTVVDPEGRPVPDLGVQLANIARGGPRDDGESPSTRTDGVGRFEFTDVGEGVVGVAVNLADDKGGSPGARRTYRGGISDVAVGRTDVRLVVQPEYVVLVRFTDPATGMPIDLRRIEYAILPAGTPEPGSLGRGASGTGTTSVRMFTYEPGRYDVVVRSPGFETGRLTGLEVGATAEVTIDLPMRRLAK